jgi:hypothetical protein
VNNRPIVRAARRVGHKPALKDKQVFWTRQLYKLAIRLSAEHKQEFRSMHEDALNVQKELHRDAHRLNVVLVVLTVINLLAYLLTFVWRR